MSVDSRKIDKLETVDLVVSGYVWGCPHCGKRNDETSFGLKMTIVECAECGDRFRVLDYWE